MTSPNYDFFKSNERDFQNKKYSKTALNESEHETSIEAYEGHFLTAFENGGYIRGSSFLNAVQKLPAGGLNNIQILDYCCGRGDLAVYLAQKGAQVSGIDLSKEAIAVANFKAQVNNLDVDFREMDAEDMKFPDNTFDFIIGCLLYTSPSPRDS